jgi:hypothetical protein
VGDGTPVTGRDADELLPGGHFVVHHVDVHVGEQPVRAIEISGEPASRRDGQETRRPKCSR